MEVVVILLKKSNLFIHVYSRRGGSSDGLLQLLHLRHGEMNQLLCSFFLKYNCLKLLFSSMQKICYNEIIFSWRQIQNNDWWTKFLSRYFKIRITPRGQTTMYTLQT